LTARVPWLLIALCATTLPAAARAGQGTEAEPRLLLRLGTGAAYVHESWTPGDGNPGSIKTGWAPVLEIALGRAFSADLVAGGLLQVTPLFAPTESFAGVSYHLTDQIDLISLAGLFVEDAFLPRLPLRAGISVGAVVSTLFDEAQQQRQTRVGVGLSPYLAWDRRLSGRWRAGLLARTAIYRNVSGDLPSSASAGGVVTSVLLTFAFR
jgi:hypothetical protein